MSLPFGTIQVNQVNPSPALPVNPLTTQTVAIIGPFPMGPTGWTRVDPASVASTFGTVAQSLNYSGPVTAGMAAGQSAQTKTFGLSLLIGRTHTTTASAFLTDGSGHNCVQLVGAGVYGAGKGNYLSIAVVVPELVVNRLQFGAGGGYSEVQQLLFYNTTGSAGTFSLTGVNNLGASKTTASITFTSSASALAIAVAAALNNGSTGLGAAAVTVQVDASTAIVPGSISLLVSFNGTSYAGIPQTLLTVSSNSITGGSGGIIPPQSITITDTSLGTVIQTIQLNAINSLLTSSDIVNAINSYNFALGTAAILSATLADSTNSYSVITQTVTLSGGFDGAGGTVANDSNGTIAALLSI